ncbi:MAG TPA: hypothetical protein VN633_15430 [Bryobacteraceae bacterium]|nr:hypothetical protein [Bryobacteraceae bacterium]
MFSITRFATTLALASGLAFIPGASAQTVNVKGSFDLPVSARWSQMKLAPGHYTLVLERSTAGFQYIRLHGPTGTQMDVLMGYAPIKTDGASYIRLEKFGGTYAVNEFHCAASGQDFTFHAPKDLRIEARNRQEKPTLKLVAINSTR